MQASYSSIFQCPGCSKALSFQSAHTNVMACPLCGTVLVKESDNSIVSKAISIDRKPASSIQPGTTGAWKGQSFTVTGGFTAWFDESVFSYWTIIDGNNKVGWLAEGYGHFYMMQPMELPSKDIQTALGKSSTGEFVLWETATEVMLEKKQKVMRWEIEGELFMPFQPSQFTILDFDSIGGRRFTFLDFEGGNSFLFEVFTVEKESLRLITLRQSPAMGKTVTCKDCGHHNQLKAFPYSQSFGCAECGTYYEFKNALGFQRKAASKAGKTSAIPLYTTGTIDKVSYEVVGYTQKEEKSSYHSRWREYTLFNQQEGFAFLSEYDGHWIFLKEVSDGPVLADPDSKQLFVNNKGFDLFNSYSYKIINACGEFPYNIFDNGATKCSEFISPPLIWIHERDSKEGIRWFYGKRISKKVLASQFAGANLPYSSGVGAVQPGGVSLPKLSLATFIGFLLILFTYYLTTAGNEERQLLNTTIPFADSSNTVTYVTEKYELGKRRSNIKLIIYANVRNSWFELDATLVNAKTGKEYSLEKGVEYYYGYTDGENWTEGSNQENAYFTRVPAGSYFLQLQGIRESNLSISEFMIEIQYDVSSTRNLWYALVLFGIWPVAMFFYSRYIETERWKNSPYSTYSHD